MLEINKLKEELQMSRLEYSKECLQSINKEEVFIHFKDGDSTSSQLYNIYKIRFEVEKQKKENKTFGYENLLKNLSQHVGEFISVFSVFCKRGSYIVFSTKLNYKVVGILKSYNSNKSDIEKIIPIYRQKKLDLNFYKYLNGKLVQVINS